MSLIIPGGPQATQRAKLLDVQGRVIRRTETMRTMATRLIALDDEGQPAGEPVDLGPQTFSWSEQL